ncbi:LysR family transcriptional regulator [Sphingomonas morindae]|uniref:LysR family transcriptional regulator n=1 Tax=Sphingomonas morindae TaxID=1541170 RepID=A0ABY4XCL0_9SPHN|nr:LysR family transcriptional regulator [Sphingomonas morindae]USI74710.1 LysR family transcriptional regulator [Sphingomonas morindae]
MEVSLADLTAFSTVARYRSFRAAADAMGVSRSSLSHAVRGLEERLGVRLLHRTTRSVSPTEVGARLLRRLGPVLGELDAALAEAAGAEGPAGPLRINALEAAARWLLAEVVPAFLDRHPRVELDLVVDDRLVDIVAEGFDAGVRLREAVPQDMVAVPFGGEARFLAVASPAYLAAQGEPATPEDLKRHRCIRQRLASGKPYRWEFQKGRQELTVDVPGALTLNNSGLMVAAAIAGLGIAFVPERAAAAAFAEGRLRPVLADWSPSIAGLCLYFPGHRHVPTALRAFADAVRAAGRQR